MPKGHPSPFDKISYVPVFITQAHHEVHEGDMYSCFIYDEDAALNETIEMYIKTPTVSSPQKRIHMVVDHNATGEHLYELNEAATYTSGGADVLPVNRRRDGGASSLQAMKSGSDKGGDNIVTGGTPLTIEGIWTGSGKGTGGASRGLQEFVLAPNQEYLMQSTAKAAGGIAMFLQAIWYEHTDA